MTLFLFDFNQEKCIELTECSFAIDGPNITFEVRTSNNKPKFNNLIVLMNYLERNEIRYFKIFCDRSLSYCIDDKKSYSKLVEEGIIIETPEGTKADIFILQYAFTNNSFIISNDRFKEFYSIYEKGWIERNRISFKIIDNEIYFDKLIIIGGEKYGKES